MAGIEDLQRRVSTLEARATAVAEEVADARNLAAGAGGEVAELGIKVRVTSELIQALHHTQSETLKLVSALDPRVGSLEREVRAGFAMTGAGFAALAERLDRAIGEG